MMADVVNSISSSPNGRSNSFVTSTCSSNNTLVSPKIVEAIDRIFPKSPSQLLPHAFISSPQAQQPEAQYNLIHPTLSSAMSTSHVTTDITTTATAIFTGLSTTSGTKSPMMSLTPGTRDVPSLPIQKTLDQNSAPVNGTININKEKTTPERLFPAPKRVSKADLEIMNNFAYDEVRNGILGRNSFSDKEFNDSQSKGAMDPTDSDDMCRPFNKIKKKRKKKCKGVLQANELDTSSQPQVSELTSKMSQHSNNTPVALSDTNTELPQESHHSPNVLTGVEILECENVSLLNSAPVHDNIKPNNDSVLPPERTDIGYTTRTERQKLPKVKYNWYHLHKNSKKIRKTFVPSFIVLKKVEEMFLKDQLLHFNIPLKERVQFLSLLCAKRKIECKSRRKIIHEILNYTTHLDSIIDENSEDEFRFPRGRSLRKRRPDISYVEPTEDDLLVDEAQFSKRKRSKKDSKNPVSLEESKETSSPIIQANTENQPSEEKLSSEPAPATESSPNKTTKKRKKIKSALTENLPLTIAPKPTLAKESSKSNENNSATSETLSSNVYQKANDKTSSEQNLVYVYPKKSVQSPKNNIQSPKKKDQKRKSTELLPSLSVSNSSTKTQSSASIPPIVPANIIRSTLSIPPTFSGAPALPTTLPLNSSVLAAQLNQKNLASPNVCVMKINGRDFLVPMQGTTNIQGHGNIQPVINTASSISSGYLPPNLMSSGVTRYMLYQPSGGALPISPPLLSQLPVTTKSLTPAAAAFAVPSLPVSVTLPGRSPSSTIHLLPSALPITTSISSSTSRIINIRAQTSKTSSVTTATTSISAASCATPSATSGRVSSIMQPITNFLTSLPSTVSSATTSASVISRSASATSSAVTSAARQSHTLASLISASRSTTAAAVTQAVVTVASSSAAVQILASNSSSSSNARCFRIIVPGCSATGSTARIATLGTSALTSPLTRLAASSSLLPQRKPSTEKSLSPEKRAAKRRRLEKKYPLPPGVIIKTEEPEATPAPIFQTGSVRSLLSTQNIQLIAASRSSAGGVQRFRIIAPNTPGGVLVGSRPVRLGSNVIIRTPVISASSSRGLSTLAASSLITSFSPASVIMAPSITASLSSVSTSPLVTSSLVSTNRSNTTTTTTTSTTTSTTSSTTSSTNVSRGTISLLSPSSIVSLNSTVTTTSQTANISSSCTFESTGTSLSTLMSGGPSDLVTASVTDSGSLSNPQASGTSQNNLPSTISNSLDSSVAGATNVDIEALKQTMEKLSKLISSQEALGLKGGRLDKLKEVLTDKKNLLSQIEMAEVETQPVVTKNSQGFVEQLETAAIDNGSSADDPVVID